MPRYAVSRFDGETFVVIDKQEEREICICGNYEGWEDGEERAKKIASLLNENIIESEHSS